MTAEETSLKDQIQTAVTTTLAGAQPLVEKMLAACGERGFCFVPVVVVVVAGNKDVR